MPAIRSLWKFSSSFTHLQIFFCKYILSLTVYFSRSIPLYRHPLKGRRSEHRSHGSDFYILTRCFAFVNYLFYNSFYQLVFPAACRLQCIQQFAAHQRQLLYYSIIHWRMSRKNIRASIGIYWSFISIIDALTNVLSEAVCKNTQT